MSESTAMPDWSSSFASLPVSQQGSGPLYDVLMEHWFRYASHDSIGSDAHCGCGFRPRDWSDWAEHVQKVMRETYI